MTLSGELEKQRDVLALAFGAVMGAWYVLCNSPLTVWTSSLWIVVLLSCYCLGIVGISFLEYLFEKAGI